MFKIKTIVTMLVIFSLAVLVNGNVYAGGKGATPNGKPFLEINGYIHEIEGEVSSLQDQIDSLVERVDTIEERVGANEDAILDLETMNLTLQAQIDANATDIESVEADIAALYTLNADLQAQIDEFGDATGSLQDQIDANSVLITALTLSLDTLEGDLQCQIDNNNLLITALQDEISEINELLSLKQNIIDGTCPDGSSLQGILSDGSLVCEPDSLGATGISSYRSVNFLLVSGNSSASISAYCPEGYIASGGGFDAPYVQVKASVPSWDVRSWVTYVSNRSTMQTYVYCFATCIKLNQ